MIDKVALIYIKDNKVLSTLSKGKSVYYFPGGKRENNETDEQVLIREIKEELSVDILPDTIKPYGVFKAQADGKKDGVIVSMTCMNAEFTGDLKPANEIEKIVWLTYEDKDKVSPVDKLIFDDLRNKELI